MRAPDDGGHPFRSHPATRCVTGYETTPATTPRTANSGPGSTHVASEAASTGNSPTEPKATRLARQLALAYEIDRLVEDGAMTYAEAARRLGVSRARISQIANLRWLPVSVQERILAGEIDGTERDLRGS